jgi:hypothetical protein
LEHQSLVLGGEERFLQRLQEGLEIVFEEVEDDVYAVERRMEWLIEVCVSTLFRGAGTEERLTP